MLVKISAFCDLTLSSRWYNYTGDLNDDGDEVVVARGGVPGGPDTEYRGIKGESLNVTLDLKLIADIGLVG